MRDVKEIGSFRKFNKKANQAYQTYASLYLDFVDDNTGHFFNREMDISPIEKIPDESNDFQERVYKAYLDAAFEIAKVIIEYGYWTKMEDLYHEYPLLKERSEDLETIFYEREER